MKIAAGQVAVITGGASGIGLALAAELAARDVRVVLADLDKKRLENAVTEIGGAPVASGFKCDVADSHSVEALRDFAISRHGQVDLVFNNAGVVLPFRPMWEYSLADWDWLLKINLWGVIHGIRAFVPHLVERGRGHVINTASMAGMTIIARNGVYNASKHAVVSLTETLLAELAIAAPGVRASVACPGLVATRIHDSVGRRPDAASSAHDVGNAPLATDREAGRLSAGDAARLVLQGVEEDRPYIFTNAGSSDRVRERFARVLNDLTDQSL